MKIKNIVSCETANDGSVVFKTMSRDGYRVFRLVKGDMSDNLYMYNAKGYVVSSQDDVLPVAGRTARRYFKALVEGVPTSALA